MHRLTIGVVACCAIIATARGQDGSDPAVVACEATVLIKVPPANYRRVAATIDRNVVSITYQASTNLKPQTARCLFKLASGKGWSFDNSHSPEAAACIRHGDRIAAMIRAGTAINVEREKARSLACLEVLRAAQREAAPSVLVGSVLTSKNAYPIAADATVLKQP
jgi:hypothetical protein